MQDELFLRHWTAAHGQFTADLDHLVGRLGARAASTIRALRSIGRTYASDARSGDRSPPAAASTLLSGLAAVATAALLLTAAALVVDAGTAPGIASASPALAGEWKTASSSAPVQPA